MTPPAPERTPAARPRNARVAASVVVVTRNEERFVDACLRSLLAQETSQGFEVVVVDSASKDGTLAKVRELADADDRLRVVASDYDISVGAARNIGVSCSRAKRVFFVSADTEVEPGWLKAGLRALDDHDAVYGRQEHAPLAPTPAAVSRGLRYHVYDRDPPLPPVAYASHVGAGYRREVLERFPFREDAAGSALDDILLARQVQDAGLRIVYAPDMRIRHRDADTFRGERSKLRREAEGWGELRREVGWNVPVLAWGGLLATAATALVLRPSKWTALGAAGVLMAPGLRRAVARRGRYPAPQVVLAVAMAPILDLQYLSGYLRGLARKPKEPDAP